MVKINKLRKWVITMELLTIEEMRILLKISRSKAYMLIKQGGFPIVRIGKCIRIDKNQLLNWLQIKKL